MIHTLVVGGTRGIGRAVVRRFASEPDAAVSVLGRAELEESALPNVRSWSVDAADASALQAAVDEVVAVGPLRNLVLLQRYRGDGDAWQGELDVSLSATRLILDQADRLFAGTGAVVIVGSHAAELVAGEQPVGYHAAKAALRQMARFYAVALGPAGIRVNCVTPGAVLKEESRERYLAEPFAATIADATPLGRIGTSEDVADAVAVLCSDATSFVTGQELAVDGGLSLLWQESLIRRLAGEGS